MKSSLQNSTLNITKSTEQPKLLELVRGKIRLKHYSIRTEQAYLDWIKRYILHFHKQHPSESGATQVEAFLTHLTVVGKFLLVHKIR